MDRLKRRTLRKIRALFMKKYKKSIKKLFFVAKCNENLFVVKV